MGAKEVSGVRESLGTGMMRVEARVDKEEGWVDEVKVHGGGDEGGDQR